MARSVNFCAVFRSPGYVSTPSSGPTRVYVFTTAAFLLNAGDARRIRPARSESPLPSATAGEPPTVFVADASPLDCDLLSDSLSREHLRVLGSSTNSQEAIAAITAQAPNVALISTRLADGPVAGFQAAREVSRLQPATRMIMLLDSSEAEMVVEAFRSGAKGVFSRTDLSSDLCKCIRCVHAGQVWADSQELVYLTEALRSSPAMHLTNGLTLLTKREEDVVNLVAAGMSNREIAKQCGLSEHTVKNYIFNIFEKLGVSTRVELALYALSHPVV